MKKRFKKVKKYSKKNRVIFIGVVLIFIIVILLIIVRTLINKPSKKQTIATDMLEYINNDELWSESVKPNYFMKLLDTYEGELSTNSIKKSVYYVTTELFPQYYLDLKNATEEEIIEYYKENQESIYINIAIENSTQFVNLIKSLQSLSGETIIWESYRLDKDTIKAGANYTKAVLYITYEGNEELAISITVKNKISSDCSSIIYRAYEE